MVQEAQLSKTIFCRIFLLHVLIDGVYNTQNDRIWAANRDEADQKGGIHQKKKFPEKVMVWLGVCSKGVSPLVIFE